MTYDYGRPRPPSLRGLFLITLIATLLAASCSTAGKTLSIPDLGAKPEVSAWLCGGTWLLVGYLPNETFIPLEPEHGATGFMSFKSDGTISGSTGVNEFGGTWSLRKQSPSGTFPFSVTLKTVTRKKASNEIAAKFDRDVIRLIGQSQSLKTEKDFIHTCDGQGKTLLRFLRYEK
jgi:hypothetical protein